MASSWDTVLPNLVTSIFDKALLGLALAGVGFVLQKRLEVFKRDQALASELAKARIAAYHRVFAAVSALDAANNRLWAALKARSEEKEEAEHRRLEDAAHKRIEHYTARRDALVDLIETERFLLGNAFARAARKFAYEIESTMEAALQAAPGADLPDAAAHARRAQVRRRLLEALVLCLPPFARAPEKDVHFSAPDFDTVYAQLTARAMQGKWK